MSFVIKWKYGQGCTKWPLNLTKFSFFRKMLSLFPLKTLCPGVNFSDKRYHLFMLLNTSNFFIKITKQLVNQQRTGTYMRVSMGLTVSRKKAKILTVNRKSHYPIETLLYVVCFQWNISVNPSFEFSFGSKDQRYKIEAPDPNRGSNQL